MGTEPELPWLLASFAVQALAEKSSEGKGSRCIRQFARATSSGNTHAPRLRSQLRRRSFGTGCPGCSDVRARGLFERPSSFPSVGTHKRGLTPGSTALAARKSRCFRQRRRHRRPKAALRWTQMSSFGAKSATALKQEEESGTAWVPTARRTAARDRPTRSMLQSTGVCISHPRWPASRSRAPSSRVRRGRRRLPLIGASSSCVGHTTRSAVSLPFALAGMSGAYSIRQLNRDVQRSSFPPGGSLRSPARWRISQPA